MRRSLFFSADSVMTSAVLAWH